MTDGRPGDEPFPVVDVSDWPVVALEPGGAARGHTLSNIRQVLRGYGPPPGFSGPPEFDAFSVFAGYLVLVALISNRDRHSENWAVLRGPGTDDGSRAGDSIFLLREPEVFSDGATQAMFFVHGVRHQQGAAARIGKLRPGDPLYLSPEPGNEFNTLAVLDTADDDQVLGWVPDLLADYVQHTLSTSTPAVRVSKVNDEDTPQTYGCWSSSPVSFRLVTVHSTPLLITHWHDTLVGRMHSRAPHSVRRRRPVPRVWLRRAQRGGT